MSSSPCGVPQQNRFKPPGKRPSRIPKFDYEAPYGEVAELGFDESLFNWNLSSLFTTAVVDLAVSGLLAFMWCYALSRFMETHATGKKVRMPYLIASFVLFCMTLTASIVGGVSIYEILLRVGLGDGRSGIGWATVDIIYTDIWSKGDLVWDISVLLADMLMVYRFYLVWAEYPWVTVIPVSILLANLGVALRTFIPIEGLEDLESRLDAVDICLSVGLNVVVTVLISVRLLRAHKRLLEAFPLLSDTVHLNAISILVESAAPVAVFGIGTVVASFISTVEAAKAGAILQIFYKVAATLSPQLIIFRVLTGRSWADRTETKGLVHRDPGLVVAERNESTLISISGMLRFSRGYRDSDVLSSVLPSLTSELRVTPRKITSA
ncbi:hypothetical protein BKA70DRAFT_1424173 [Coprinopsis sp. MPI-PUGE-AT-0042]|nr:hypothetical protein BKA70DRAFT_1424173 [Coprinopsis sp. MPI-PUGE-AT-0042]